jgi:hypothetical protein
MEKSNGWNQWAQWVFDNIARHDKNIENLDISIEDLNKEFIQFKIKFYGFLGGFVAVILAIIYLWISGKL